MSELEPITPDRAVELYLRDKQSDCSDATVRSHKSRLKQFVEYLKDREIDNLNDLDGRLLKKYKIEKQGQFAKATLKTHMDTVRVFTKFLFEIDAVPEGTHLKVESPSLTKSENSKEETVFRDTQTTVEEYLDKFEHASVKHVYAVLLMTGLRVGAIRAIDLSDYSSRNRTIELLHRPEEDTPLKNKKRGERVITIDEHTRTVLDDYIDENRVEKTDEYGRKPLLSTDKNGRPHPETLRKWSYGLTRPCEYTGECPHDRDIDQCDAARRISAAYGCPSSKSPHPWRRGTITWLLSEDAPPRVVGGRCDVTIEVIKEHYDERTETQKMESRKDWLDEL